MSSRFRTVWHHSTRHGLLAVIAAITLHACGKKGINDPPGPAVGLSISQSGLSLIVGDEGRLAARAVDSRGQAASASFAWSSADPAIATVDKSDGTVTAISAGNTMVTVAVGALRATATVSVRPPAPPVAVSISPSGLTMIAGSTERLNARVFDSTGLTTRFSLEWSSADPAVATVNNTYGVVTAIASGSTMVTVVVGSLRATATVSVIAWDALFAFTRVTTSEYGPTRHTSDILAFSSVDGGLRALPRPLNFASLGAPAWSADGTRLAVEVSHEFFDCPWMDYTSDLYVLDAAAPASSTWRALTANGLSKAPSWSPDGKRIAYLLQPELGSVSNDIYIVDAAGGAPVRVTRAPGWYSRPSWSPDGTRLTFSMYVEGGSVSSQIFTVSVDGSGLSNLNPSGAWDTDPSWSPDGARLAFVSSRDNLSGFGVFVMNVDGSNVRRLTPMVEYPGAPAWSPDGQRLMFSSGASLYAINADGTSLVRLTAPPLNSRDSAPAWRR